MDPSEHPQQDAPPSDPLDAEPSMATPPSPPAPHQEEADGAADLAHDQQQQLEQPGAPAIDDVSSSSTAEGSSRSSVSSRASEISDEGAQAASQRDSPGTSSSGSSRASVASHQSPAPSQTQTPGVQEATTQPPPEASASTSPSHQGNEEDNPDANSGEDHPTEVLNGFGSHDTLHADARATAQPASAPPPAERRQASESSDDDSDELDVDAVETASTLENETPPNEPEDHGDAEEELVSFEQVDARLSGSQPASPFPHGQTDSTERRQDAADADDAYMSPSDDEADAAEESRDGRMVSTANDDDDDNNNNNNDTPTGADIVGGAQVHAMVTADRRSPTQDDDTDTSIDVDELNTSSDQPGRSLERQGSMQSYLSIEEGSEPPSSPRPNVNNVTSQSSLPPLREAPGTMEAALYDEADASDSDGGSSSSGDDVGKDKNKRDHVQPAPVAAVTLEHAEHEPRQQQQQEQQQEGAGVAAETATSSPLTYQPTKRIPPADTAVADSEGPAAVSKTPSGVIVMDAAANEDVVVDDDDDGEEEVEEAAGSTNQWEPTHGQEQRDAVDTVVNVDGGDVDDAPAAATVSMAEERRAEQEDAAEAAAIIADAVRHDDDDDELDEEAQRKRHSTSTLRSLWRRAASQATSQASSGRSSRKSMFGVVKEAQFASKFKAGVAKFFGVSDDDQLARWEEFYLGDEDEEEGEGDGTADDVFGDEDEEEEDEDEDDEDEEEEMESDEGAEEEEEDVPVEDEDEDTLDANVLVEGTPGSPPNVIEETTFHSAAAASASVDRSGGQVAEPSQQSTVLEEDLSDSSAVTEQSEHPYDNLPDNASKRSSLRRVFSVKEPEPDDLMPVSRLVAGALRNTIKKARRRSQAPSRSSMQSEQLQMRAVSSTSPPGSASHEQDKNRSSPGLIQFGADPSRGRAGLAAAQAAKQVAQPSATRPQPTKAGASAPRARAVTTAGAAAARRPPQQQQRPQQREPRKKQALATGDVAVDPRRAQPAGRRPRATTTAEASSTSRARPTTGAAAAKANAPAASGTGTDRKRRARAKSRMKPTDAADTFNTRLQKQVASIREHRPFFTYYMSFCQIAVMIIAVLVYGLAPIGIESQTKTASVDGPDGTPVQASYQQEANFWIGPSPTALVLMGAKFTPCMRRDDRIYTEVVEPIAEAEQDFGCCVEQGATDGNCFSSSADDCTGFRTFIPGKICGGPQCCKDYRNNASATYPNCEYQPAESAQDPSCSCTISARPCCTSLAGDCSIQSQQYCEFVEGHYHPDAELCSQVSCLQSVCGLVNFLHEDRPDQWYRLYLAMFLHVGFVHLFFVVLMQHSFAVEIEKLAGWLRMFFIYMLAGIGGYLVSANFTPYQVSTGASPALYGLLGCLFVELFQSWQLLESPKKEFLKLFLIAIVALAVGLLPYIDNWSHLGGFAFGILSSIVFLPYITFGKWDAARKRTLILIALPGLVALITVLSILLATRTINCSWCGLLNCYNFTETFCVDNLQEVI
ncbi:hypothetical protein PTSG_02140 [Salpingoeca rosetta]|uniref:Peptidase S54 rhomboid domain-containing protein n=1 Tax=Salpingoeca rosetta (strain ATCC 50818 / BSB-021) TaxID=946362 RepID=F2U1B8_SALR5|nr:uncharacterized protein PTSG_02140 [Salpingoeca rosetta]EGD81420.1 hypothetical protein PTSG_02140 [Salpingoeca rosetta]|eukprot:XP_004996624.1 hypothetical protein PTSG_02140 [Salpingoeca rosetta]